MVRGRLALPAVAAVALLVLTSTPARGGSATTFQDAFTGRAGTLATARTWTYETGGRWGGGRELQQYTRRAANAALTGRGTLLITARGETYRGADGVTRAYTSARLVSRQAVRYGTVAARIRTSGTHGAWPAFWTLGSNYPQ